ncbi:YcbK family protein [Rhizobium mesosinicum]|uniref:Murein endopeptidase K n=1 Tax=Rhizobium mesosinicum TaxID=335017 RepID=A0ABS7GUJ1_9HYPH|nr:D-Ala-D-Ala carboxypeptidase family metallohydrolase [Rhizobium mesosinicum]MBW9053431.1 YcbK family protein [Rhizobium mesosinicum]
MTRNNKLIAPSSRQAVGAVLIASSILALSGCVSDKKALDSAAVATPAAEGQPAPRLAAAMPAASSTASKQPYRDPMLTNVSGVDPQVAAQDSNALTAPTVDPATQRQQPANIGGLVMQSTRINAQAMSIFSDHQALPQNNSTSTIVQPQGVNAYAPENAGPRSSVFSAPPEPQQGEMLPQQSSQDTSTKLAPDQTASLAGGSIPGSTMNALYSAPKQNLLSSLSGLLQKASLPGMTRSAPNGLHVQNDSVEVGCFKPDLMRVIKTVETHFGKPVVVTSGYRDPQHNREVGGAEESMHKSCEAADIQINGVSKWDIAEYIRSLPNRGGVGTYCHTDSVHLDTGNTRDWNWGCGRKRAPIASARAI